LSRTHFQLTVLEERATPTVFTPDLIRQAYNINFRFQTADGHVVAADGTGQTIAVVTPYRDPNIVADLHAFDQRFGLPDPQLVEVGQHLSDPTRLPATAPSADDGSYTETALDVEWVHAIAPGAAILLVEADSLSDSDANQAVDVARRYLPPGLPQPSVVSMSFGSPTEYPGETSEDFLYTTPPGHTPITFVAATGDDYGYGGYAAYSPNVLAVGGTTLTTDAAGNWQSEKPWRKIVDGEVEGTAGGFSDFEPEPGWQLGVQQTGARGIPDVAYDADPDTGFYVYDSASDPAHPWVVVGGTSAGTPQWSALIAVVNEGRALSGRLPLDGPSQTLPFMYGLPDADFHVLGRAGQPPGWNIDTGRGTPIANRVVADLLIGTGISVVGATVPLSPPSSAPLAVPAPPPKAATGPAGPGTFAVGEDAGGDPLVNVYNADGTLRLSFDAFEAGFTGGVRVAVADVTGDGTPDVIVAPGPGREPEVRIFDATTGALETTFQAFESTFQDGVNVAVGSLDGLGHPALVVTPDEGGGPRVRVFNAATQTVIVDFFGIDDPAFRGGARAAVGDVNGDGSEDLLVAAGFGGGPRLALFDGRTIGAAKTPGKLIGDFFVFEPTLRNGVYVAAGDLDGDRFADVIAGGGPGGGPRVFALSGKDLIAGTQTPIANFFAGDTANRGGIRLAIKDLDGDANMDVVTGSGIDGGSRVTTYAGKGVAAQGTPPAALSFDAFPDFTGGVFVG
jgi:hypothetical protein